MSAECENIKHTQPARMNLRPALPAWIMGLALTAMAIAAYLAVGSLRSGGLAGCGENSGCNAVLSSSWARWLDVPVSVLALGVYAVAVAASIAIMRGGAERSSKGAWWVLLSLAFLIVGAVVWFLGVMLIHLRARCIYCGAIHLTGLLTAVLIFAGSWRSGLGRARWMMSILVAAAGLGILMAGQLLKPSETFQLTASPTSTGDLASHDHDASPQHVHDDASEPHGKASQLTAVQADQTTYDTGPGPGRRITPPYSELKLEYDKLPKLAGSAPDAPHVLLMLGDYRCQYCQFMHSLLLSALERYRGQISVVYLPLPLSPKCNPWAKDKPGHEDRYDKSCEMARLGLAVQLAAPTMFSQWDHWITKYAGTVPLSTALEKAVELVGKDRLQSVIADPWIDQQIQQNVGLFMSLPDNLKQTVPIIMMDKQIISGSPERIEQLFEILEQVLGIQPTDPLPQSSPHP